MTLFLIPSAVISSDMPSIEIAAAAVGAEKVFLFGAICPLFPPFIIECRFHLPFATLFLEIATAAVICLDPGHFPPSFLFHSVTVTNSSRHTRFLHIVRLSLSLSLCKEIQRLL